MLTEFKRRATFTSIEIIKNKSPENIIEIIKIHKYKRQKYIQTLIPDYFNMKLNYPKYAGLKLAGLTHKDLNKQTHQSII